MRIRLGALRRIIREAIITESDNTQYAAKAALDKLETGSGSMSDEEKDVAKRHILGYAGVLNKKLDVETALNSNDFKEVKKLLGIS